MTYPTGDARDKPTKSYEQALDNCVRENSGCQSIWAQLLEGQLVYRLGLTKIPVLEEAHDGSTLWKHCADE